jgi:SAM-dependent methyltransferase
MHTALYSNKTEEKKMAFFDRLIAKFRRDIADPLSKIFFELRTQNLSLKIGTSTIPYFSHWYNYTWTNERAIEIPYFLQLLRKSNRKAVLEIGNTLSHYTSSSHTIIDKYEHAPGVLSIDVMDYKPKKRFDLIIAISTFEHIGWHEADKDRSKALNAIRYLQTLLKPDGKLVFSIPLGVNPGLDDALLKKTLPCTTQVFLRRVSAGNLWEISTYEQVRQVRYNTPFPNANAIMIGEVVPKQKKIAQKKTVSSRKPSQLS